MVAIQRGLLGLGLIEFAGGDAYRIDDKFSEPPRHPGVYTPLDEVGLHRRVWARVFQMTVSHEILSDQTDRELLPDLPSYVAVQACVGRYS